MRTGLNSDLPSIVVAQVTENVFDMVTGRTLLIPQGSRLIGSYEMSWCSGRATLLVWQRIILPMAPPSRSTICPRPMPLAGYADLSDKVDYHI